VQQHGINSAAGHQPEMTSSAVQQLTSNSTAAQQPGNTSAAEQQLGNNSTAVQQPGTTTSAVQRLNSISAAVQQALLQLDPLDLLNFQQDKVGSKIVGSTITASTPPTITLTAFVNNQAQASGVTVLVRAV
jgi:hypothetical protein